MTTTGRRSADGPDEGRRTGAGTPSAASVREATGRAPEEWFALLDAEGAEALSHRDIARRLQDAHGLSGWWAQSVTVQYERARGRRAPHEVAGGFQVSASRTVASDAEALFARAHERLLAEASALRVATPPRTARYDMEEGRAHLTVTPRDDGRATAYVVHERLPDAAAAERWKAHWRAWLAGLTAAAG